MSGYVVELVYGRLGSERSTICADTEIEGSVVSQALTLNGRSIMKWMGDTREEHIRRAVIEMGWTPPGGVDGRQD